MRNYEAVVIVRSNLNDEKIEALTKRFEKKIVDNGGEFIKFEKMGHRRLPYRFQQYRSDKDGIYLLIKFKGEGKSVFALRNDFRIQEDIIRHLIAKIPEEQIALIENIETTTEETSEIKEVISGQPQ